MGDLNPNHRVELSTGAGSPQHLTVVRVLDDVVIEVFTDEGQPVDTMAVMSSEQASKLGRALIDVGFNGTT